MLKRTLPAACALALLPALAGAWGAPPAPPDDATVTLPPQLGSVDVWPYTGTSFDWTNPSDPVNLFFLNVDPRAIRQALMALPPAPPLGCTWIDAMGYEQTSWASTESWVGSEIQLACIHPGAPFGDPFRLHLRLFRQGSLTVGAAHFEMLIPNTAQHQVLSWDFARDLVVGDVLRADPSSPPPSPVGLTAPGNFRDILYPVYEGLFNAAQVDPGLKALLQAMNLPVDPSDPPPEEQPVPIPSQGYGLAMAPDFVYDPVPESIRTEYAVTYNVNTLKPFCSLGENDFVNLSGDLHFVLTAYTDWSGRYYRSYKVDGELIVTSLVYDPGTSTPAVVKERHAAVLADHYGQVYELTSQRLLSDPPQTLFWKLTAGEFDFYLPYLQCGQ